MRAPGSPAGTALPVSKLPSMTQASRTVAGALPGAKEPCQAAYCCGFSAFRLAKMACTMPKRLWEQPCAICEFESGTSRSRTIDALQTRAKFQPSRRIAKVKNRLLAVYSLHATVIFGLMSRDGTADEPRIDPQEAQVLEEFDIAKGG